GQATVTFQLPDNLTTWRATAIAHTLDTRLGRATHKILTAKDFQVRVETPRFLTQNDQSRIVALVHNDTGTAQSVSVRLSATKMAIARQPVQTLTVEPGTVGQVVWPVAASGVGETSLRVTAWTAKSATGAQY